MGRRKYTKSTGLGASLLVALLLYYFCMGVIPTLIITGVIVLFILAFWVNKEYMLYYTPYHYGSIITFLIPVLIGIGGWLLYVNNYQHIHESCIDFALLKTSSDNENTLSTSGSSN